MFGVGFGGCVFCCFGVVGLEGELLVPCGLCLVGGCLCYYGYHWFCYFVWWLCWVGQYVSCCVLFVHVGVVAVADFGVCL